MNIPIRTEEPAIEIATDQQSVADHRKPRVRNGSQQNVQASLAAAFLQNVLAGGAVRVSELEEHARSAGLLGEHNHIGDAKIFKSAKKRLGVKSRRGGFGRGGEWFWQLPTSPSAPLPEVSSSPASIAPVSDVYAGALSPRDISASTEALRADAEVATDDASTRWIPSDWIRGVELIQLRTRPLGIPVHRWRLFIDDCRRFLASPWAPRASELGWGTVSVFGSRFHPPHEYLAQAGLAWNLSGGAIVAIYKDGATIIGAEGRPRTFHRRPDFLMTRLPWD